MKHVRALVAGVAIAGSCCFPSSVDAAKNSANVRWTAVAADGAVVTTSLCVPHCAVADGLMRRTAGWTRARAERFDRPAVARSTELLAVVPSIQSAGPVGSHERGLQSLLEGHTASADPAVRTAQLAVVQRYLQSLTHEAYASAYALLNAAEQNYYRNAANFASVYVADAYHVTAFQTVGDRDDPGVGRVFFMRETARFRDHAHDADLNVTATVPLGVVADSGAWRIKDPGHPWRAYAARATAAGHGVRLVVKKMSFFARRIEAVVTFTNLGAGSVTILAYGKSVLHDADGRAFRIIETRDWSLTDKQLFEGLHLASGAQYTGTLGFACQPFEDAARRFSLSIGPLLRDGADAPFSIDVEPVVGVPPGGG